MLAAGKLAAAPHPCSIRKKTWAHRLWATPHSIEPAMKSVRLAM